MENNAVKSEKRELTNKAAVMDRIPLMQLHILINERRQYALEGSFEHVNEMNKMICNLLACNVIIPFQNTPPAAP